MGGEKPIFSTGFTPFLCFLLATVRLWGARLSSGYFSFGSILVAYGTFLRLKVPCHVLNLIFGVFFDEHRRALYHKKDARFST